MSALLDIFRRVLPDTEHRLAHVLAGPAGRACWSSRCCRRPAHCCPATTRPPVHSTALARRLSRWPWAGPVYPVAVLPDDQHSGLRRSGAGLVPAHAEVTIRTASQVRSWVAGLPAPLGRFAAAELAAEVEAACPPAAVREAAPDW